ncbi:hypothetical protein WKI40_01280 [Kosakonia sacchari]|uniref:hypothetical protein n=1 Tax=Kosakonia sacchari TaxID=1158459 RepID=UPI0030C42EEA
MFGIFPEKEAVNVEGELVLPAAIVINNYKEAMNIPLSYWTVNDYKNNWFVTLE